MGSCFLKITRELTSLGSQITFLVVYATTTTTTTLLNQIIIVNGWPTPQIARKKANRGGASPIQEHTY